MAEFFAALFVIVLVVALAMFLVATKLRAKTGLPFGARIVYSDTGAWEKVERPLFSRRHALTGKPDYIVEQNCATIPIEVKPNRRASSPRESDVLQLAAYGLLIEETYHVAPPFGLLKYRDDVFQVDFDATLRARLLATLDAMRADLDARDVPRNHDEPPCCRACGYRDECGQALE